ncbi:hypothetical protein FQB35_08380 [Crassaminicella thermophila]|uniref:Uncharacterized protein n=2 Tax=Crassaminicella thermophila TaxID=2599308 RepID=A0A5C0SDP1_CRATE|nr:hypothetical protein FQB35_08380 [Crassaminicella thermophila]
MSFTLNTFLNNNHYITTFKSYIVSELKISNELLKNYLSDDQNLRKEASKSIILTTLKNLNYEQWIEYIDYINLLLFKSNVLPSNNDELIVALNLSKDLAVVAIYTPINGEYVFTSKIENLLPIQNIRFLQAPGLDYNFIITDQLLDEKLGAFFLEEFIEIFLYLDEDFKSVWKKTKYKDEIYNASWLNPKAPNNEWIKIIENNDIKFKKNNTVNIDVFINRQKFKAFKKIFPIDEDFKLEKEIIAHENYYWSPKYERFIMNEGIIKNSTTPIAIIDDTKHWLEAFLGFHSNNYKIITKDKKIYYINKQFVFTK